MYDCVYLVRCNVKFFILNVPNYSFLMHNILFSCQLGKEVLSAHNGPFHGACDDDDDDDDDDGDAL